MTLTCSVEDPAGMEYEYEFRRTSDAPEKPSAQTEKDKNKVDIPDGGKYICRGGSREQYFFTPISNDVTIQETGEFSDLLLNKTIHTFFMFLNSALDQEESNCYEKKKNPNE